MSKSTKTVATSPTPLAFSYIRFSSKEQRKGDSLRRQVEAATKWCEENNVKLDTSTTLHDLGKSAFTGKHRDNPDRNALAAFLKMVEVGKVSKGSHLIVESLDRLTREDIQPALLLILSLLQDGIRIVQLIPVEKVYDSKSEMHDLMLMLVELSRGNSESRVKADRVGKAWKEKREAAKNGLVQPSRKEGRVGGMRLLTHQTPAWVEEKGGELVPIPTRAAAVKRIFSLAAAGYGLVTIIKKLNADGVKPFGTSDHWTKPYVARILRDRRALGEYQARDHGKDDGPPIKDYFPVVVTESEFYAAKNPTTPRRDGPKVTTRVGKCVDLFAGLLRDARGGNYVASTRHTRILINNTSLDGRANARTYPLEAFERGLLRELREVKPRDVIGTDTTDDEVTALEAEEKGVGAELKEATAWMDAHGFSPTIAKRVTDLEVKQKDTAEKLAEARSRAASPASDAWAEFRDLVEVLDEAEDKTDTRVRLRAAIRRVVTEIVLLVVAHGEHGRSRFCVVEVHFQSGAVRKYLLWYRSASNGRCALYFGQSWKHDPANNVYGGGFDLKKKKDVTRLDEGLASLPQDEIDDYARASEPLYPAAQK